MKAIMFADFASADVLHLAEASLPEIRPDDVLVKVMAAAVNRADLPQRGGSMARKLTGTARSSASKSPAKSWQQDLQLSILRSETVSWASLATVSSAELSGLRNADGCNPKRAAKTGSGVCASVHRDGCAGNHLCARAR
jgi:hypothetical protein